MLLVAVSAVLSCVAVKGIDLSNIDLGMSKSEVELKTKPFFTKTIGAKQFKDGKMEVFQVSEVFRNEQGINDYWLYFFNDKLVSSEPITTVRWKTQDWDYNVDKIYFGLKD